MKRILLKATPGSAEWEAICQRCGRCCYEKIEHRGRIYHINQPCKHLDTAAKTCRVYWQRDSRQADCVRLTPELVASGILPPDCPYVVALENCQAQKISED